jgi:aminopeptidase N
LLAHEIGHQWFYAQVGSNETYRAALDEGFTQFLTAWALTKIDGDYLVREKPSSKYGIRFRKDVKAVDSRVYYAYLRDATKYNDPALNTHSDDFGSALGHGGGYRHVYYKTGAMLYNLQYVLGDEFFLEAMQHYFQKWKMAHPYFEDFREAIIEYTKVDLNWFFDQWMETSKTIDYSIDNVKNTTEENFEITFERKGEMQMPIDFSVYANDGKEYKYHIPNHWFVKNTDATVLNKWHAWGKLYPKYTATLNIPSGIERVVIDPTNRLADKYMLNNVSKVPMEVEFDSKIWNMPDWKQYELNVRPDVWYNNYDGVKLGFHINGDYMNYHHKLDANIWLNTAFLQDYNYYDYYQNEYNPFSYRFNYNTGLDKFSKHTDITLHSRLLDGLNLNKIKLKKYDYSKKNMFYASFKSMFRAKESDLRYTNYKVWESDKFNNTATFGWTHSYKYKGGDGQLNLELTSSTIASDYDYSKVVLTSIHKSKLGKLQLNTRLFGQYGSGSNWAGESVLNLAGANSEELMENKFTRAEAFIPNKWLGYGSTTNHFQMGGGLNLRGYAGYYAAEINDEGIYTLSYNGTSGASISAELEFQNIFSFNKIFGLPFKSYLFADAGVINTTEITRENYKEAFSKVRSDAGLGLGLTFNKWGPLQMVKPITLRLDLPFFLNRYPSIDEDYFQTNRFVVGIGRTF